MANCEKLELTFEDNDITTDKGLGSPLYVLKATLNEGLDLFASGTIQLLAPKFLSPNALRKLLHGKNARLKLTQCPESAVVTGAGADALADALADTVSEALGTERSYRFFSGQIRAVRFLGQTATLQEQGQKKTLYHYELLLTSPLQAMSDHHHLRSFTTHSLLDVLSSFFDQYLPDRYTILKPEQMPDPLKQKQQIWVQNGESDALFVQRLLLLHGLNFSFEYGKHSFLPQLYLSYGATFDQDKKLFSSTTDQLVATQNTKGSLTPQADCFTISDFASGYNEDPVTHSYSSAQELLKAFPTLHPLLSKIGVDDVQFKLTKPYKEHVATCLKNFLELQQQAIYASANDLALQVGNRLTLTGLGDDLELTITQAQTQAIAPLPDNLSLPQALISDLNQPLASLDTAAANAAAGISLGNSLDLSTSTPRQRKIEVQMQLKVWEQNTYALDLSNSEFSSLLQGSSNAPCKIFTATVCNANGQITVAGTADVATAADAITSNLDRSASPSLFYALIKDSSEPIVFNCQQANLSAYGGISQHPHLGDRVLLLQNAQGFFFLGFDQNSTDSGSMWHNDFWFDQRRATQECASLSLEHSSTAPELTAPAVSNQDSTQDTKDDTTTDDDDEEEGKDTTNRSRLSFDYFNSAADCVAYLCYYENLDPIWKALSAKYNLQDIWLTYQSTYQAALKAKAKDIKSTRLTLLRNLNTGQASQDSQQKKLAQQITAFYQQIEALLTTTCQQLGLSINQKDNEFLAALQQIRANLLAEQGDILISAANGTVRENGQSIALAATNDLNLHAPNITISADSAIQICVGGNAIGITQNGITLDSQKWTNSAGALDALLYIDSINGVTISGLGVAISSYFGAILSDAFGATVQLSNGALSLQGITVSQSTTNRKDTISKLTAFTVNVITELANLISFLKDDQTNLNSSRAASFILPEINNAFNFMKEQYHIYKERSETTPSARRSLVLLIIESIVSAIEMLTNVIQGVMFACFVTVLDKPITPHFTVRDALRAIILLMKSTTLVTSMISVFALQKVSKASSFALEGANIKEEAETHSGLLGSNESATSPLASLDVDPEQDAEDEGPEQDAEDEGPEQYAEDEDSDDLYAEDEDSELIIDG